MTTTFDVMDPADGKRSLREAITAANNLAGADTIILPTGVFKIALAGASESNNATGDLDIFDGVTIRIAGAGASIIDGQQLDRVFAFGRNCCAAVRSHREQVDMLSARVLQCSGQPRAD